jgi:hypothetical protein
MTGKALAGENLDKILAKRNPDLPPPMHMCDGSTHSLCTVAVNLINCLVHARRKFYDIQQDGDKEMDKIIDLFGVIFKADRTAKEQNLKDNARMAHLNTHASVAVTELESWMRDQMDGQKCDPKSPLAVAIKYCLKRWSELTKFLTVPGAPMSNNESELQILRAVIHRKNSRIYLTPKGAECGDIIMSVTRTCFANRINPFHYMVSLMENRSKVIDTPQLWLPWNYKAQLNKKLEPKTA